ncbi:hypothetical protein AJ79_06474 [Helicocarpus griseus UAMH5409]|uniref:Amino acid permease/ SLC12A domain-containing protein n=1 Tax=Helicocarpus griseus UAMH5409 TaxID=1447875 RepID=A0A2B7XCR1_9EURO|nr:hypothetical protein AJ79_06474 [Helicocarpus griseus UAMH5409]
MPGPEEKNLGAAEYPSTESAVDTPQPWNEQDVEANTPQLARELQGRHMQMIAIGGSIGAGLFIGSGKALSDGGPGSLLVGFLIVGIMMLCTMQALGEMATLYPVNGAFYMYSVRFIDPAWGFAMGWQYAISWLMTLPFEITAVGITIQFWRDDINISVWAAVFLFILGIIQILGVRGYGETEFVLALIKIIACIGLIILGVIINVGGVPTDTRGYIGGRYWRDPGAFRNGFKGFSSVFVVSAFAYSGAELVGLSAAEAADPTKSLPRATKQVFWRVAIFYIANILLVGLNVPSDSEVLLGASGANSKASPFVLAIQLAGIKVLPHIINAVITISVISVANSATYGFTRTLQALASSGKAPKAFAYIDSRGRPVWCIVLQIAFGFLAFLGEASSGDEVFTWLLAMGGLAALFTYGSICFSHIQLHRAWKRQGKDLTEIPWRSPIGVVGSWIGLFFVCVSLIATFYVSLFPIHGTPSAKAFLTGYLAAPIALVLFAFWKAYTRDFGLGVDLSKVDLEEGRRLRVPVVLENSDVDITSANSRWKSFKLFS